MFKRLFISLFMTISFLLLATIIIRIINGQDAFVRLYDLYTYLDSNYNVDIISQVTSFFEDISELDWNVWKSSELGSMPSIKSVSYSGDWWSLVTDFLKYIGSVIQYVYLVIVQGFKVLANGVKNIGMIFWQVVLLITMFILDIGYIVKFFVDFIVYLGFA